MYDILELVIWSYLLFILGGLAIVATLVHMLYTKRSPSSILVWLLLMIIAPYIFVFFYFIFGVRKHPNQPFDTTLDPKAIKSAKTLDILLQNNRITPATKDNSIEIFTDTPTATAEFFKALEDAKQSIYLCTYVFKYDAVGKKVLKILEQKAQQGVEVVLLIDSVGSFWLYLTQFKLKKYKKNALRISFFKPLFNMDFTQKFNLRNHRKIYIIDKSILLSGGMNIANEYMGSQEDTRWIDILYKAKGAVVNDYLAIFEKDLAKTLKNNRTIKKPPQPKCGDSILQALPSGPDIASDALFESLLHSIYSASKNITIVTPYFIPDEQIVQALKIAWHKGVMIKMITPQRSNHKLADITRSSYIRQLREWGVPIYFYKKTMLHAKAIIFDDATLILGSINLDYRSLLLNYEVVTISYSKTDIQKLNSWIDSLIQDCTTHYPKASKPQRVFENFTRVFASQL
ncbi:MAG: phospholipase D-like domain-containing protein [Campylobacterota bacterium]